MSDFFSKLQLHTQQAALSSQPARRAPTSELERKLRQHEAALLEIPGVEGFAPAADHVRVYVSSEEAVPQLPDSLDGTEIRPVVTGEIRALTSD